MIFPKELNQIATLNKVRDQQIEKDYVLSWLLFAIAETSLLYENLVFKGGTVLKKAWFRDYRFSEDLDFTLADDTLPEEALLSAFQQAFIFVGRQANLSLQLRADKTLSHTSGSLQLYVDYAGPLKGQMGSRDLKIDITRGEVMEMRPVACPIFRDYSDLDQAFSLFCYPLAEVLIEKMAALMGRTEPRDLYDFWFLTHIEQLSPKDFIAEFGRKATNKGHNPLAFPQKVLAKEAALKRDWENKLRHQVHDLPHFDTVFREAKRHFKF